jgi:predicted amidohydrolase YtcJ
MDVFEASSKGADISASRPRLEHAQIITQADRERLGRLGGACFFIVEFIYFTPDLYSHRQYTADTRVSPF